MAKPSQCAGCTKPATIHLTQIKDNQILKVDMCENCVFKDKLAGGVAFEPLQKLATTVGGKDAATPRVCPTCGTDTDDLRRTGRFGCPECYDAFGPRMADILKGLQPGLAHEGKTPRDSLRRHRIQKEESNLRRELEAAIREERFEDAAALRDNLRHLTRKGDEDGPTD